ncbi:MAG: hypothetical protein A2134_02595 [Candidatus Woykebacteria bacterium RBG_16_39_9b]|uniref:Uncharacterized protein n=1 Tax=Candidatus Woykebacteria bacterium RBG_16_39_9b TaxID=1802595 RepID=A0A1G1WDD8_9BACT|nr:MAG: hypothetical protein A2134_02595 [Candidatus Woykebacteria bacterium RBG_16_39_9b]
MPKKTKAQKISSQLRRLKYTINLEEGKVSLKGSAIETEDKIGEKPQVKTIQSISSYDYSYVFRDLKRIIIISTIIILLEIVLSLTASI